MRDTMRLPTNLVVIGDKAMLAHVHTVFEAE